MTGRASLHCHYKPSQAHYRKGQANGTDKHDVSIQLGTPTLLGNSCVSGQFFIVDRSWNSLHFRWMPSWRVTERMKSYLQPVSLQYVTAAKPILPRLLEQIKWYERRDEMTEYNEAVQPWGVPSEPTDHRSEWRINHPSDWRTVYKHDVDEIIYTHAYRKLAQKTQVIVQPDNDAFRTRLTHTLEVAQIADNFSYRLGLNRDLTKAIAFGHDLGHPPFAHMGEQTLDRLLTQHAKRSAIRLGASEKKAETISRSFSFRHPDNSRRVLQRKTSELSAMALHSVVGHGWAPWKDCSTLESMEEVQGCLARSIIDASNKRWSSLLTCYEAQAVALSDQIAGLNSDVEDLVHLEHQPDTLRRVAFALADRLAFDRSVKDDVRSLLDRFVSAESSPQEERRGWGRKHRFGLVVDSIIVPSREEVKKCQSYEDSAEHPLVPELTVTIALDVLEKATRSLIYANPVIQRRDALASAFMEIMFYNFLTLEPGCNLSLRGEKVPFAERMREDYESWKEDYDSEVAKETADGDIISYKSMERAASQVTDLWLAMIPVLAVADYISEMTDQFVIHEIFHGNSVALMESFDRSDTLEH